jgi:hypothetical protein
LGGFKLEHSWGFRKSARDASLETRKDVNGGHPRPCSIAGGQIKIVPFAADTGKLSSGWRQQEATNKQQREATTKMLKDDLRR